MILLALLVQRYVPLGASVADLYAGAGVIRLSLAATRKCRSVRCIEINKESKLSFEKTVARLPNIVDSSISWHHADTSKLRHRRGKSETTRAQYINTKDVRLTISTWNVAGRVPDENLDIDDWISSEEPSDIYMFNGMAELSMTIAKLPVFYKHRKLLFFPPWAYALPAWLLKIPLTCVEVGVWVFITYYVIGFDPNVGR
ncbi:uncharacterized protein LOC133740551 [Rosa rugosa]|uniref:uncharacterized protein LOC133740551 n=1 Tax=Rosa rugosa TaxID=74645 RepID=UPI002B402AA5|nr:uncharacterized protein LOC133740551 [Rosa rugosa]